MQTLTQKTLWRYGVAAATACGATALGVLLQKPLGDGLPFAILIGAVLLTAWLVGTRAALLATVIGAAAAAWFFLPPHLSWAVHGSDNQAAVALFVLVACGVIAVAGMMRTAREQSDAAYAAIRVRQEELEREVAERRRTEQSLRDSEARLRLALEAGRMETWEWTLATDRFVWSPGLEAIHGVAPGDSAGTFEAFLADVHPEDRDFVRERIEATLKSGDDHHIEYRLLLADGTTRWVEARGKLSHDAQGQPERMVGVCVDITERKRVEEALKRSEEQFRRAIVKAPIPIVMHTEDGEILQLSENWTKLSGYTREDIPTFDIWLEKAYGEKAPEVAASIRRAFDSNEPKNEVERPIRTKNGELRSWSYMASAPGKLHDGRRFLVGMATDVTDRKYSEQAAKFLADASAAISELVDYESTLQRVAWLAVPFFADWCAVDMLDRNGELRRLAVAHVDPKKIKLAHQLYEEFPPDPSSPRGIWGMLRGGHSEWVEQITETDLLGDVRNPRQAELLRELKLRSYIGVPLVVRGKPVGVMTFLTAESGRTYRHADLALAEDLARRAAITIENCQLYAEAREADRRKDIFLATLAHELRNPLAPIRSSVEVMKLKGIDDPELQWARDVIERQVHQMSRLVDDLLDISRISRGKIQLHKETVELSDVVNQAIETTRPLIESQQHQIHVSLPDSPVYLEADPTRLEQVLANLLNNAAKYTEPGGEISLSAAVEGDEVVLRVRDTGIGISAELLPYVFDVFVQADDADPRAGGGLGIGLSLVRSLIQMHGGDITAHSAGKGQGSEFVVRLPLPQQPLAAPQHDAPHADASEEKRLRVLIVDDNIDAAQSLAKLLQLQGHDVRVAHDGLQAIELFKAQPCELAFLDLGLPRMNGFELARRIRSLPSPARVQLVALTGWGQEEDRRKSQEAGFDLHLTKPIEGETLHEVLRLTARNGHPAEITAAQERAP